MPRAKPVEEIRDEFLDELHRLIDYWLAHNDRPVKRQMEGLVFCILNIFDGTTCGWPAFDIIARPHPDDKQYAIDNDSDWYEDGTCINDDVYLHELWYKKKNQPT